MKELIKQINWEKLDGLLPAIVQDDLTGQVLMLAYMNVESIKQSAETGFLTFFSRTKKRIWQKGEFSGNTLKIVNYELDCDCDSILVRVIPVGVTCHTGSVSCFKDSCGGQIDALYRLLLDRKEKMPDVSYTVMLFNSGLDLICAKIEEEAEEVCRAAKIETDQRLIEESVDLIYHNLVLLANAGLELKDLLQEFKRRS